MGILTADGLVPAHDYWLMMATDTDSSGRPRSLALLGHFKPEAPGTMELGELKVSRGHNPSPRNLAARNRIGRVHRYSAISHVASFPLSGTPGEGRGEGLFFFERGLDTAAKGPSP